MKLRFKIDSEILIVFEIWWDLLDRRATCVHTYKNTILF